MYKLAQGLKPLPELKKLNQILSCVSRDSEHEFLVSSQFYSSKTLSC